MALIAITEVRAMHTRPRRIVHLKLPGSNHRETIPPCWLGVIALVVALCRAAASGESAAIRDR
jgi:hypothetical protein